MSDDLQGLHGTFDDPLRWSVENGVLAHGRYDAESGDRGLEPIELGSPQAMFVVDLPAREHGYAMYRPGIRDARMVPVGAPLPEWPGEDFKSALAWPVANPHFGILRFESNQTTTTRVMAAFCQECCRWNEAAEGQIPLVHFIDRYEVHYKNIGDTVFWALKLKLLRYVPRDKTPFAAREMTVKLPPPSERSFARLADHSKPPPRPTPPPKQSKSGKKAAPPPVAGSEDSPLPEDRLDDLWGKE